MMFIGQMANKQNFEFQEKGDCIKTQSMNRAISTNMSLDNPSDHPIGKGMLAEVAGIVQGHRDGHGFVIRDDGEADIYLPQNEMRAVLHKDHVKVSIVRQDRRGRQRQD